MPTLNIWKAEHNKMDNIPNVPRNKTAEELDIPVRKVTDKMLRQSDTGVRMC